MNSYQEDKYQEVYRHLCSDKQATEDILYYSGELSDEDRKYIEEIHCDICNILDKFKI